jgi:hypothetical protein
MGGRGGKSTAGGNVISAPIGDAVETVVRAIRVAPNTSTLPLGANNRTIADIRDALAALGMTDRTDQNAALIAAQRAHRILLQPFIGKWMMTQREHDAAVHLAGEDQDYAIIE